MKFIIPMGEEVNFKIKRQGVEIITQGPRIISRLVRIGPINLSPEMDEAEFISRLKSAMRTL